MNQKLKSKFFHHHPNHKCNNQSITR